MFANVFTKTVWDQRRALVGWGVGVVAVTGMMLAVWPSVRNMPGLQDFLANYPEGMKRLFNVQEIASGRGFLNAELFSIIFPALFIVFGIGRGARLVAGEEEEGTLEVVLTTPTPLPRVLVDKAAGLAVGLLALGAMLFVTLTIGDLALGMEMPVWQLAVASGAMVLIGLEHGMLALAVGAATGRRVLAASVAGAVAVLGYVVYVLGQLVEAFRPWMVVSPFQHALVGGPIGSGVRVEHLVMLVISAALLGAAIPRFSRRDFLGA